MCYSYKKITKKGAVAIKLYNALSLPPLGAVSLVGGGGKSSAMAFLAEECRAAGLSAVVSTTTHIGRAQGRAIGPVVSSHSGLERAISAGLIPCAALPAPSNPEKLSSVPRELLTDALELAGRLIVEADGAHRLPVKAPGDHEPQIFQPSAAVVAVAGLSALGKPLGLVCHRPELTCALLGVSSETLLTPPLLARLLTSEQGQFKQVGHPERFRILLNQADDDLSLSLAADTALIIQQYLPRCRVVAAALREQDCVKGVFGGC